LDLMLREHEIEATNEQPNCLPPPQAP